MIQALPYNDIGLTYRAKNINFVRPIIEGETETSLLYQITTTKYGDEDVPCELGLIAPPAPLDYLYGCPRFLVEATQAKSDPPNISTTFDVSSGQNKLFDTTDTFWGDLGIIEFDEDASYYKAETEPDSAYFLIGDSGKEFIAIAPNSSKDNVIELNKYEVTQISTTTANIHKSPIHMGLGNKPVYIGNDENSNLPIMTLTPDYDGVKPVISVNTTRVLRDITVVGTFKVLSLIHI